MNSLHFFRVFIGLSTAIIFSGKSIFAASQIEKPFLPEGLIHFSSSPSLSQTYLVVDKNQRLLRIYEVKNSNLELVAEHPTDIGKRAGDKEKENDYRTPVGIYFLQKKMSPPEIPFDLYGSVAFTTDYPNIFDKRSSKSGSGIWLHAIPDTVPLTRGSRGCVVVRDNVIQNMDPFIKLGQTPLLIFEDVKLISRAEFKDQQQKFLNHFEAWRKAWETSDVDQYIQFYDPTFRNDQMDYNQWYRHKRKLKKLYQSIHVELGDPVILKNKDQVVIRTLQKYTSNLHSDFGEKTIHAHYSTEVGFKIIREDWKRISPQIQISEKMVY